MNRIRTRLRLDTRPADEGLSLAEVIVAMMIFAIISIAVAGTITNSLVLTRQSQNRETAVNVASQTIDLYRSYDDVFDVEDSVGTVDKTVGGRVFHVATSGAFTQSTSSDVTATACSLGTGSLQYFHVTVAVTWDGMGAASPVYSDTQIAPNSRINNNTQGTIIVAVTGASGAGTSGVTVTATPKTGSVTPTPVTTDAKGCAYLLKVDPGDYTVAISKTNGIDVAQVASPSQVKTVTAGASIAAAFTYDTAATYPLVYPSGAALPTNLTMSFVSAVGGTYTPKTLTNPVSLFPFSDGYSIIAGSYAGTTTNGVSCLDRDPGTWSTAASDGAVGHAAPRIAAQGPGLSPTDTVNVDMGTVTVTGINKSYPYITAVGVVSAAGTGDPGCASAASTSYTFAKVGSTTTSLTLALPYGSWILYMGSSSGSTYAPFTSSSFTTPKSRTASSLLSGLFVLTLDPRTVTP